jgi:hypothetical protein
MSFRRVVSVTSFPIRRHCGFPNYASAQMALVYQGALKTPSFGISSIKRSLHFIRRLVGYTVPDSHPQANVGG